MSRDLRKMLQVPPLGLVVSNLLSKGLQVELPTPDESAASQLSGQVQFGGTTGPPAITQDLRKLEVLKKRPWRKTALNQGHMTHMALV